MSRSEVAAGASRRGRVDFARLNHILIPSTKTGRDRLRRGAFGWIARPLAAVYRAGSPAGRVVVALWLVVGALGLDVLGTRIHALWCVLTGLLVASWLFRRAFSLTGVEVTVTHPARVTMGERLEVGLELHHTGEREIFGIVVEGPLLPWDGRYDGPAPAIRALAPGARVRRTIPLSFSARGEHHLDPFHLAVRVPLGLALGPSRQTAGLRFLVLPRPARVTSLRLPSAPRHQPGGVALASRTGEARELIGLRPYRPGDPVRDLSVRAWARLGVPVVREYQQEYFTRVGVVLDTDAAVADDATFEAAIRLTAGVLAHLVRSDALVDLVVAGDRLHRLTLGRSLGRLEQALDLLAVVRPSRSLAPDTTLMLLDPHLARLSAVVFVALVDDPDRAEVARKIEVSGVPCRRITMGLDADARAVRRDEDLAL